MAPKDTPKPTPKVRGIVDRANSTTSRASPKTIKKTMPTKKPTETKILKVNSVVRQRSMTVPNVSTPTKEKKPVPVPGSITKSVKKASWKRRPKPAHSGVPVPEKMKKLLQRQLLDSQMDSD